MPRTLIIRLVVAGAAVVAGVTALPSAHAAAPKAKGCNSAQAGAKPVGHAGLKCEYTATVAAGFKANGTYILTIRRSGRTYTFSGNHGGCGKLGLIRKGDVVAHKGKDGTTSVIRSGPGAHC